MLSNPTRPPVIDLTDDNTHNSRGANFTTPDLPILTGRDDAATTTQRQNGAELVRPSAPKNLPQSEYKTVKQEDMEAIIRKENQRKSASQKASKDNRASASIPLAARDGDRNVESPITLDKGKRKQRSASRTEDGNRKRRREAEREGQADLGSLNARSGVVAISVGQGLLPSGTRSPVEVSVLTRPHAELGENRNSTDYQRARPSVQIGEEDKFNKAVETTIREKLETFERQKASYDKLVEQGNTYRKCIAEDKKEIRDLKERLLEQECDAARKTGEIAALGEREDDYKATIAEKDKKISLMREREMESLRVVLERDRVIEHLKMDCKDHVEEIEKMVDDAKKLKNAIDDPEVPRQGLLKLSKELTEYEEHHRALVDSHILEITELRQQLGAAKSEHDNIKSNALENQKCALQQMENLREELAASQEESEKEQALQEESLSIYRAEIEAQYQKQKDQHVIHRKIEEQSSQKLENVCRKMDGVQRELNNFKEETELEKAKYEQIVKFLRSELVRLHQDLKDRKAGQKRASVTANDHLDIRSEPLHELQRELDDMMAITGEVAAESAKDLWIVHQSWKEDQAGMETARKGLRTISEALQRWHAQILDEAAEHKKELQIAEENLCEVWQQNQKYRHGTEVIKKALQTLLQLEEATVPATEQIDNDRPLQSRERILIRFSNGTRNEKLTLGQSSKDKEGLELSQHQIQHQMEVVLQNLASRLEN